MLPRCNRKLSLSSTVRLPMTIFWSLKPYAKLIRVLSFLISLSLLSVLLCWRVLAVVTFAYDLFYTDSIASEPYQTFILCVIGTDIKSFSSTFFLRGSSFDLFLGNLQVFLLNFLLNSFVISYIFYRFMGE